MSASLKPCPQIIRYASVGGMVAAADLVFFTIFASWLMLPYLWVNFAGFILGTICNYLLSVRYVFESGKRYSAKTEVVAVYIVSIIGLTVSQFLLYFLVSIVLFPLIASKILTLSIVFFWNYFARKNLVFR